jgi:hypothetical protein
MKNPKRKIKAWKGGRSERIYARITPTAKNNLLDRVMREGYKNFADWLEAQALPQQDYLMKGETIVNKS